MSDLEVLRKVSSEINATLDEREIFDIVLRAMDELFGFHHALILWVEDDVLRVVAARGYDDPGIGAEVKLGVGVIGVVAQKRRLMRVNNLRSQRAYAETVRKQMALAGKVEGIAEVVDLPGLPDAECQIAIPMMIGSDLVGVFSVESAEQLKRFTVHHEALASIVANQAAATIHNARLVGDLENRVRSRTVELERANRDLRDAQAQLVHSGKMASLGQLVAGVAHELNTPVGSIVANADLATRALTILERALTAEGINERKADKKVTRALTSLRRACDVEAAAAERVAEVVRSLRNFARLDEAEEKRADIHEGIDSALSLMAQELAGLEVVRDYGDVPELLCFPNQLNQAFMNIIRNARQSTSDGGTLTIQSRVDGDEVVVVFRDTGSGISEEALPRLFDPGYTTRGVGVGTGLGLSICFQILEQHAGRIEVSSALGEGSAVMLRLPRR